jgi:GTPase Era involved in 16S rRNA processing
MNIVTNLISSLLLLILIINSCNCNKSPGRYISSQKKTNVENPSPELVSEVIVFIGNPGVGKSTLCNSIFGKAVANSGLSFGTGMTTHNQAYMHEGKLYFDTPGLDDVEPKIRTQAAEEIEKALKSNKNYKIVFVATFENGRIRPADLVTINVVCDAIKVKFEYGLIFNQIPNQAMQQIEQASKNKEMVSKYLSTLHQQPSSIIFLEKVNHMEAADNIYFEENHENRQKLLTFLNGLKTSKIEEDEIGKIDIRTYQEKINDMERRHKEIITELSKRANI